jgi:hypothetical protein
VIDSRGSADQQVRFWARTWRGVLAVAGVAAVLASGIDLVFAYDLDLSDLAPAIWPICFLALLLLLLGASVEWSITGHELRRRRWLSWPGREPATVMELGPGLGVVHQSRGIWRFWPSGYQIGVPPWQNASFVSALERAGVHVNDWRGDWGRRHRLIEIIGLLATFGAVPIWVIGSVVLGPFWPNKSGEAVALDWVFMGVLWVGMAIDRLPCAMRKPSDRELAWPPFSGPAPGGAWVQ